MLGRLSLTAVAQNGGGAMINPGWYPDPSGIEGQLRFWDGQQWTAGVSQGAPPGPGETGGPQANQMPPFQSGGPGWGQGPTQPPPFGGGPGYGQHFSGPGPIYGQPGIVPKSPAIAVLVSFFLPGVGSMINGEAGTGVAILIAYLVSCALLLVVIGFLLVPVVWIFGMVHAYTSANRWNAAHGIIS